MRYFVERVVLICYDQLILNESGQNSLNNRKKINNLLKSCLVKRKSDENSLEMKLLESIFMLI